MIGYELWDSKTMLALVKCDAMGLWSVHFLVYQLLVVKGGFWYVNGMFQLVSVPRTPISAKIGFLFLNYGCQ